jgi:beta-barrel assembly-enhancing protease
MKSWFGSYIESPGAEPVEATVLGVEKKITAGVRNESGATITRSWDIKDIQASFDISQQATRLINTKEPGRMILIQGKDALQFINEIQAEQNASWHKRKKVREWGGSLVILFSILLVLAIAYLLFVPWLSEKIAARVPVHTEEQFGDAIYDALGLSVQEDARATALTNDFFRKMNVSTAYDIKITVVKGSTVNAFALPGGHIVVYSALLDQLETYPELAALLSHEFTHVNNKHSTKIIFRQLGSRIFLSALFGKFGSVTAVMADHADNLKSLTYSRKLEKEADTEGLALLQARKIDPEGFVRLFQRLKEAAPGSQLPEFLGSHPDIDNRIAYIRERSDIVAEENIQLKTIFEQLKKEP